MRQLNCSSQGETPAGVAISRAVNDVLPALYARLRKPFRSVLYKHHIPPEDAEDLMQTTLLLAVARWSEIRDPESWLLGTLHNRCTLYWRGRMPQGRIRQLDDSDLQLGVESDQTRCDLLADLAKVWHLLSPTQRKLLTLRYGEGLSEKEVAGATGLACGSVRKTALRALERLRGALALEPPPKPGGHGQREPRQPAAPPWRVDRLRAAGGAAAAWMAAVDVFTSLRSPHPRRQLVQDLAAAGLALGPPPLAELRVEDLERYRQSVFARTPGTRARMLYSIRSFLLWAGERGDHVLQPRAVCEALRVGRTFRLRAALRTGAPAAWIASAQTFLETSSLGASTRRQYRNHLIVAATALGRRPLAELSPSDLLAFRAALLVDGRSTGTHLCVLLAVRSFLSWAARQGLHTMSLAVIHEALRGWRWQRRLSRLPSSETDRCRRASRAAGDVATAHAS